MVGIILVSLFIVMPLLYFIIRDAVAEGTVKALVEYDRLKNNQNPDDKSSKLD